MKKLLYILVLAPFFGLAQIDVDATGYYLHGTEVQKLYLYGSEVYSKPSGGGELYPFDDAAGPNDTNTPPDAAWADVYSNPTLGESVQSDGSGGNGLLFEIDDTNNCRPYFLVELTAGVVYDYVVNGAANATNQIRILDPQIPGGDYAGITGVGNSDQPFFITTNSTFNFKLSPPTTGTYRIQYNFNSPSDDDWVRLNSISITAQ